MTSAPENRAAGSFRRLASSPVVAGVVLVALVRGVVMLSRADEVELELDSGSFGWAILHGLPLDPEKLAIIDHQRGSVVTGLLCALFMALLGPTYAALKFVALAWSCASVALFVAVLQRHAGRAAAYAGAVLYALLPPAFQIVDVLALGSHGQTIPFIFAALLAALALGGAQPSSIRAAALFGAICGLGYFMSLQFLVVLPALLAAWWLRERALRCSLVVAGLLLGLPCAWLVLRASELPLALPGWLVLAIAGAVLLAGALRWRVLAFPGAFLLAAAPVPLVSQGAELFGKPLAQHFLDAAESSLGKLVWAARYELRRAWLFEEHGGAWLSWIYAGGLALGFAFTLSRALRLDPLALFLILYPALWLVAYALSDIEIDLIVTEKGMGSRYLMPVLPCMAAWVALAAGELAQRGRRALAAAVALPCALAGALGLLALSDPLPGLLQPPRLGTEIGQFRGQLAYAADGDPLRAWEWAERLDPDWAGVRPLAHDSIRLAEGGQMTAARLIEDASRARSADARVRPCLWAGLGVHAGHELLLQQLLPETVRQLEPAELTWFLRGAGKGLLVPTFFEGMRREQAERARLQSEGLGFEELRAALQELRRSAPAAVYETIRALPPALADPAAEGAGFWIGYRMSPYQTRILDLLPGAERLPPAPRAAFFRALGLGYRSHFRQSTWRVRQPAVLRVEAFLSESARALFREGLALPLDVSSGAWR